MKLDEKELDKLIMEVLEEKKTFPTNLQNQSSYKGRTLKNHQPAAIRINKVRSYVHKKYFPDDEQDKGFTKPQQNQIKNLPKQEDPENSLDMSDIQKLIQIIRDVQISKANKSNLGMQLMASRDSVAALGTAEEKAIFNASVDILRKRFNLMAKVEGVGESDLFVPNTNVNQDHYKKNYAGFTFDADPAATAQTIDPDKSQQGVQAMNSLFIHDMRNYESSIDGGNFDPSVKNAFDLLFKDTKNLYQRLKVLTEFSQELFQSDSVTWARDAVEQMPTETAQQEIAKVQILDYMTSMMREMDDRASAYLFESFLALCAGGRVEGAVADDETGQMGATDFTMAGGLLGSCKYYSSTSGIKQALSGFDSDKAVHYIVAIKDKEGADNNKKIKAIKIYYFKVLVRMLDNGKATVEVYSPKAMEGSGKAPRLLKLNDVDGDINLNYGVLYKDDTLVGTLKLIGATTDRITAFKTAALESAYEKSQNLGNALQSLSRIAYATSDLNDNLNFYATNNDADAANKAIDNLNTVDGFMESLFGSLGNLGYKLPSKIADLQTVKENKEITDKILDKLIQEVILNK